MPLPEAFENGNMEKGGDLLTGLSTPLLGRPRNLTESSVPNSLITSRDLSESDTASRPSSGDFDLHVIGKSQRVLVHDRSTVTSNDGVPRRMRPREPLGLLLWTVCICRSLGTPSSAFINSTNFFFILFDVDADRVVDWLVAALPDAGQGAVVSIPGYDRGSLERLLGRQCEILAANRAGLVGLEPEIDALLVEDVVAEGQQPDDAVILELQQAYGAFEAVLLPPKLLYARVHECGERLHHGAVEPQPGVDDHHIHRRAVVESPAGEQVLHEALAEADDGRREEEHDEYDD